MMAEINFTSTKLKDGTTMHVLKCVEPYFHEVEQERKRFEIRKDDREFEYTAGDTLILYQVKDGIITGNYTTKRVIYVLRHASEYGLKNGFCIMSIK